jgi:hypothetical protein
MRSVSLALYVGNNKKESCIPRESLHVCEMKLILYNIFNETVEESYRTQFYIHNS